MKYRTNKMYKIIDILYKTTYKFYDLIIVQSNDMKDDLINKYNILDRKIKKITNLVDFDLIKKSLEEKEMEKNEELNLLFKEDKIYGISMGRLTEQKGFDILIERIKNVKKNNIMVYILGEGEEKENLENKIREYKLENMIKILPFDINPYKYLNKCHFYILPSRVEGFPNSLIEALGCGLPAIANNCLGGVNEIVIPNFNGEILDFNKDIDLGEKINKILRYKKDMIRQDILMKYNKEKILKEYMEVFN